MNEILSKSNEKKFNSPKGMSTKFFGPKLWDSLFIMVLGAYPATFNPENTEHIKIKKAFIKTMCNLKYTLPCSFCRMSYKTFYKELPIEEFTGSRVQMMYWLYLMKDKVNKKLIKQELDYLTELYKNLRTSKISKFEYIKSTKMCFRTVPSPPFIEVLEKYEQYRAVCNKKLQKCVGKS